VAQIISGSFHTADDWRASSAKENGIAGVIRHTQLRRPLFPSSFGVFRSWERKTGIGNTTAPRAEPDTFFGWKAVGAAAAMYFVLTGLLLYSFPVFLPFLRDTFGWSRASILWAISLALIVQGIASPLAAIKMAEETKDI
jgi:hypothetical protein